MLAALIITLAAIPVVGQNDDFNSSTLSPQWFWVRENKSRWSLKEKPGHMRMYTYGDLWGATNTTSLLLQTSRTSDFEICTKVTISPTAQSQQGGILVYHDDDNYIRVSRTRHINQGQIVELVSEIRGSPAQSYVRYSLQTVHLKITKRGNTYNVLFSQDGLNYQSIKKVTHNFGTNLKIGLFAIKDPPVSIPSIPADFEYFRISVLLQGSGAPNPGGAVTLTLNAPYEAGLPYQVGSSLGNGPIPIDTRFLGLSPDALLVLSVGGLVPSILQNYAGLLDAKGGATAKLNIPNVPVLKGVRIYTAFVTFKATAPSGVSSISNSFMFTIA